MSRRDFHRARRDSRLWAAGAGGRSGLVAPVVNRSKNQRTVLSIPTSPPGWPVVDTDQFLAYEPVSWHVFDNPKDGPNTLARTVFGTYDWQSSDSPSGGATGGDTLYEVPGPFAGELSIYVGPDYPIETSSTNSLLNVPFVQTVGSVGSGNACDTVLFWVWLRGANTGTVWVSHFTSVSQERIRLRTTDFGEDVAELTLQQLSSSGVDNEVSIAFDTATWLQIGIVVDPNNEMRLYVNGSRRATAGHDIAGRLVGTTSAPHFANSGTSNSEGKSMRIYDVMTFGRELTDDEIRDIWDARGPAPS
jgi:hypothetical protein